jgi:hypothetical protein
VRKYTILISYRNLAFPKGLIEETVRTLSLLLPMGNKKVRRWYSKEVNGEGLDPGVLNCRRLRAQERQMANFQFWHDRLVILKQLFDESQPSDLKMAWYDRRNGVQWYTFWVAILILFLTIFFGCIQSVEGALQVYLGYRALVQHN